MRAAPCHCERPLGRAAINRIGIPCLLIATLALLARNDKRSATKVASPNPQKKRAQSYGEAIAQPRFGDCNL